MTPSNAQSLDDLFDNLVEACDEAVAAGKPPEAALPDNMPPELTERLRNAIQVLYILGRDRSITSVQTSRLPARAPTAVRVPGYEVLGLLGRGGMGVVYKARQLGFNRLVALKMVVGGGHARPEMVSRFLSEAEVVAKLRHPHIVQVYDFGTQDDLPYFSMEYLEGGSLSERVLGQPQPQRWSAELLLRLVKAIQAAHEAGIVHRDLKPANVLLDRDGSPRITDFGLAKWGESHITTTGVVMGTPSYMAPEQAEGRAHVAGPAADIWALGAILYELLTGRPPFKGASVADTLDQVRHGEPVPVHLLAPNCPRDLETICHKCLQKEVGRRYGSAAELADDLSRFLSGEPIRARPVGVLERGWRWCRRHTLLATLGVLAVLGTCVLTGMGLWFSARLLAEQNKQKLIKLQADAAQKIADAERFVSLTSQARARIARPKPGWTWTALDELTRAAKGSPSEDAKKTLVSDIVECLEAIDVRLVRNVGEGLSVSSIAWSPDGSVLAVGQRTTNAFSAWCAVTLIPIDTPAQQRTLWMRAGGASGLTPDLVNIVAFSGDGRWLACGMRSGWLHLFDLTQSEPQPRSEQAHVGSVTGLIFATDGRSLYSSGGKAVRRCDVASGATLATFVAQEAAHALAVHPEEGWLAAASGQLLRLNASNLEPLGSALALNGGPIAFTPDGLCLVDQREGRLRAWHLMGGEWVWELPGGHDRRTGEAIGDFTFSADGVFALAASFDSHDGHARLYDLVQQRLIADLPAGGPRKVAFAPSGRLFAVTDEHGAALYEIGGLHEQTYIACSDHAVQGFCLSKDGRTLVTDVRPYLTGVARVTTWSLQDRRAEVAARRHVYPGDNPLRLSLSPQRDELAFVADGQGPLTFCQLHSGAEQHADVLTGANHIEHDGTGRLWVAAGEDVMVWDDNGRRLGAHRHLGGLATVVTGKPGVLCLSAGQNMAAAGCRNGNLIILEQTNGLRCLQTAAISKSELTAVALARDEHFAIVGAASGLLYGIAVPGAEKLFELTAHEDAVSAICSTAAGVWASGDRQGLVKLWRRDGRSLRELLTLRHARPVRTLHFHPDGVQLLVLLDGERGVRIHHLDRLQARLEQIRLSELKFVQPVSIPPATRREADSAPIMPPSGPHRLKLEVFRSDFQHGLERTEYVRHVNNTWFTPAGAATASGMSCRWSGWLRPPKAGRFTIALGGSRRARLWLDGVLLLESNGDSIQRMPIDLRESPYQVRIDHWRDDKGWLQLSWILPGQPDEFAIDPQHLFHDYDIAATAEKLPGYAVEEWRNLPVSDTCDLFGFSADGKRLASIDGGGELVIWEVETAKPVVRFRVGKPETPVRVCAFTADLSLAAAGYNDGNILLWDVASASAKHALDKRPELSPSSLAFSPDERSLALNGNWRDETVHLFDTATGKRLASASAPPGGANLIWSSDGRRLFVGRGALSLQNDNAVRLFPLPRTDGSVRGLALHPQGRTLAIGFKSGRIMLVNTETEVQSGAWFTGHKHGQLNALAFSPDGSLLATAGAGGVRLWRSDTGDCVAAFGESTGMFRAVRFSPGGDIIATGSDHAGKSLRLWRVQPTSSRSEAVP